MPGKIHSDLVAIAAAWLMKKYPVVITDMVSGARETPDAIGIRSYESTLIECKASRGDFLRDARKPHRRDPDAGMGNFRYFLTTVGMVKGEEVPEGWGLLEADGRGRLKKIVDAARRRSDHSQEQAILLSALRRIGQNPPPGVSVKCYTIATERTATIGFNPYAWNGLPLYSPEGGINMSHPDSFNEINDWT